MERRDMSNIWQTTNQQPWASALADGLITVKTRTAQPSVLPGDTVLLHASKSGVWRDWRGLSWTKDIDVPKLPRGVILAIATVEAVGPSEHLMTKSEKKLWKVKAPAGNYDSRAYYAIRYRDITKLGVPVPVDGMLTPFARAKDTTIKKLLKLNPKLA